LLLLLVIEEANWLSLPEDIEDLTGEGFDALICMGNSFAHLPDFLGDQQVFTNLVIINQPWDSFNI
jgi:hypothetical protein